MEKEDGGREKQEEVRQRVMEGATDEESSSEMEAVTGYQLCLDI